MKPLTITQRYIFAPPMLLFEFNETKANPTWEKHEGKREQKKFHLSRLLLSFHA